MCEISGFLSQIQAFQNLRQCMIPHHNSGHNKHRKVTGREILASTHQSINIFFFFQCSVLFGNYYSSGSACQLTVKLPTLVKEKHNVVINDSTGELYITRYFGLRKSLGFRSCQLEDLWLLLLFLQYNHLHLDSRHCCRSLLDEKMKGNLVFLLL